jgi:hypothetical protein
VSFERTNSPTSKFGSCRPAASRRWRRRSRSAHGPRCEGSRAGSRTPIVSSADPPTAHRVLRAHGAPPTRAPAPCHDREQRQRASAGRGGLGRGLPSASGPSSPHQSRRSSRGPSTRRHPMRQSSRPATNATPHHRHRRRRRSGQTPTCAHTRTGPAQSPGPRPALWRSTRPGRCARSTRARSPRSSSPSAADPTAAPLAPDGCDARPLAQSSPDTHHRRR